MEAGCTAVSRLHTVVERSEVQATEAGDVTLDEEGNRLDWRMPWPSLYPLPDSTRQRRDGRPPLALIIRTRLGPNQAVQAHSAAPVTSKLYWGE